MRKTIKLKDAVGTALAHDITEIRPGEFKGAAFRKGHVICDEDICHLQRLGKNHLYVIDLAEDEIHENEAAAILATALAGRGIVWKDDPREGKIELMAARDGASVTAGVSVHRCAVGRNSGKEEPTLFELRPTLVVFANAQDSVEKAHSHQPGDNRAGAYTQ